MLGQSVQVIEKDPKSLSLKLKQIGNTAWLRTVASKSLFSSSIILCATWVHRENKRKELSSLRFQEEYM